MKTPGHTRKCLIKDGIVTASRQTWKAEENRRHLSSIFISGWMDKTQKQLAEDVMQEGNCG